MDFYEELGVGRNATEDEIRVAYRALARLLHPDQQQDPVVRAAAERQMQRLNALMEILTNPERRREYDRTLRGAAGLLPRRRRAPGYPWRELAFEVSRQWFWVLTGALALGFVAWYLAGAGESRTVAAPVAVGTPAAPQAVEKPAKTLSRRGNAAPVREVEVERGSRREEAEEAPRVNAPAVREPRVGMVMPPPVAPMEPAVVPEDRPAVSEVREAAPASLRGVWLFVPSGGERAGGMRYAPLYIEMSINQDRPAVRGSYRARYRVPDRPVSSEVAFQFEGEWSGAETAKIRWRSPAGAEGEGMLRFTPGDLVEINWWTTVAGGQPELASGSAKLLRQRTR